MMGGMPPMRPPRPHSSRRGTSRAVPVVVSAGLAVGVFCGLLFGLGTGDKADANAGPSHGNNIKHEAEGSADPNGAPAGLGATTVTPTGSGNLPVGSAAVAVGSGTGSGSAGGGIGSGTAAMAGAGSGSAAAPKTMKLTIDIDPDTAASTAAIVIDGKAITGKTVDVPPETKQVHVQITSAGYHSVDENVDVSGSSGDEHDVKIKMLKRASGGTSTGSPGFGGASSGGNHVPTAPPKPKKPANNGIIDI